MPRYRRANSSRSAGSPAAAARIMVQQVDSEVGTVFLVQARTRCRSLVLPGGSEFKMLRRKLEAILA